MTDFTKTNPHSYKTVVAIAYGETVCEDHAPPSAFRLRQPEMDICWACAKDHREPVRKQLAKA